MIDLNYKIIIYVQTEVSKIISNSIKHSRLHPLIFVLFR